MASIPSNLKTRRVLVKQARGSFRNASCAVDLTRQTLRVPLATLSLQSLAIPHPTPPRTPSPFSRFHNSWCQSRLASLTLLGNCLLGWRMTGETELATLCDDPLKLQSALLLHMAKRTSWAKMVTARVSMVPMWMDGHCRTAQGVCSPQSWFLLYASVSIDKLRCVPLVMRSSESHSRSRLVWGTPFVWTVA